MYCTISAFLKDWEEESKSTQKFLDVLTDDSLDQKVWKEGRTLGRIAWHIYQTIPEMMHLSGFTKEKYDEKEPVPKTAKEISDKYKSIAQQLADAVKKNWSDEILNDEIELFGQKWAKGKVLLSIITHQIHHRGQLSVLIRQAGLKPPGVYGPAKEEWAQYGMDTAE